MTLGTAILLLALSLAGMAAAWSRLREKRRLRAVCMVVLGLAALVLAGYIGLTALLLAAAGSRPSAM